MNINNKQIAIVGGGPGGLTLARLLQVKGANVKIYERDLNKDVRVQGATLDLHHDSGLAALREAGLIEAFYENYRPGADKMSITDQFANVLHNDAFERDDELSRPEIDRGPLRKMLLDSLLPGTVVWNSHLQSLLPSGEQWLLQFENGTSATADLVIAADGANSKIRPYITDIKPFFAGVTIVEGYVYDSAINAPNVHRLLNGGKIFALGDEKTLIVSSKGDGSLVFYAGLKTDESWHRNAGIDFSNSAQVFDWFQKEFGGWDKLWLELFAHAEPYFTVRPQYCMPTNQEWESQSNITMLGDAAHLMPPYAGEGVNMAMQDALELYRSLTNSDYATVHKAIQGYEKQMRARTSAIAQMTLEQTAALHSQNATEHMMEMFG